MNVIACLVPTLSESIVNRYGLLFIGTMTFAAIPACSGASGAHQSSAPVSSSSSSSGGAPSSSGSNSSSGRSEEISISCNSDDTGSLTDPYCQCSATGTSGTPFYSGTACDHAAVQGSYETMCCAGDGYPNGGSCNCYITGNWHCWTESLSCGCGFYGDPIGTTPDPTACNTAPGSDGHPWTCCADTTSCTCNEYVSGCGTGQRSVSDCLVGAQALGITMPMQSCPSGTSEIGSCSSGPTPSGSGGSSSGSGSGGGGCNEQNCGGPPSCFEGVCCTQSCQGGACVSNCG